MSDENSTQASTHQTESKQTLFQKLKQTYREHKQATKKEPVKKTASILGATVTFDSVETRSVLRKRGKQVAGLGSAIIGGIRAVPKGASDSYKKATTEDDGTGQ